MIRDITLGQYYFAESCIHRLDPRTKLLGALIYIVALFLTGNWIGYMLCAAFIAAVIILSKVPIGYMLRGLKFILIILIISVAFNLFLTPGRELISFWKISITYEGVWAAFFMAVRLICLVLGASLVTYTTTPTSLTDGLESGLGFLRVIGIPVHEMAMMMSIALRFIPILTEELDKIMKAQMARGADFESGNIIRRARSLVPILVPLFVSAFRRAGDLANAMEARCYRGGKGRTKLHRLLFKLRDGIAYVIIAAFLSGIILIKIFL